MSYECFKCFRGFGKSKVCSMPSKFVFLFPLSWFPESIPSNWWVSKKNMVCQDCVRGDNWLTKLKYVLNVG